MGQLFQFSGIGSAEITNRLPKLKDGFVGVVQIKRTEVKPTRQQGPKLWVDLVIVESNMPGVHPIGQVCAWGQTLLDANVANGSLQRFVAAVAGISASDEAMMAQLKPQMDGIMNQATAQPDTNALINRRVRVETNAGKTGNNRDFMFHNWSPAA